MDVAAAAGLRVGCAPDTFMGGRLQTCRRLIDDGRLGDIVGASAFFLSHGHEWHHPSPAFLYGGGAGPIFDIGPYYITALLSLLGPVGSVAAMASRTYPRRTIENGPRRGETFAVDVDTHVTGALRFASGAPRDRHRELRRLGFGAAADRGLRHGGHDLHPRPRPAVRPEPVRRAGSVP